MVTNKQFVAPQYLTNAAATYYTAPANTTAIVKQAGVYNSDTGALTFTLHVIASGGSASAANMIVGARPIGAGETQMIPELLNVTLPAGSFIQALASSASKVSLSISGAEIV